MRIFLDSSAIIELFKSNKDVSDAIKAAEEAYTSSICAYEVLTGERYMVEKGMNSSYPKVLKFFDKIAVADFTYADSILASRISAKLISKGKKVDDFDILIAAQALAKEASVLTKDTKHFRILKTEMGVSITEIR